MLSFIFYQATLNSLDIELLGNWLSEEFFIKSLTITGNLLLLFMLLFCLQFLELKKFLPSFHKIGKLLLWITISSLMASFILPDVAFINNFTTCGSSLYLSMAFWHFRFQKRSKDGSILYHWVYSFAKLHHCTSVGLFKYNSIHEFLRKYQPLVLFLNLFLNPFFYL